VRKEPTSTYENLRICYIVIFVNILRVAVTFCGHQYTTVHWFGCLCKISFEKAPTWRWVQKGDR